MLKKMRLTHLQLETAAHAPLAFEFVLLAAATSQPRFS
ncbi:hypothetical protein J2X98_002264 [Pseudarthrobacter enclensis]|uniref:Uncharacterized protein n=1 Tax=Pseudarthrobacter enclensis TaxID=993070 RepID=A0ABT9RV31_9MICC|nr:hypothetical protein [Pseudarthrobacter enclensis]